MWEIFSFLFHLLHQKIFPKFYLFEVFFNQKIISKAVFFFRRMMTTMEEQLCGFCQFSSLKNHWKKKKNLKSFVSRNVFKKGDFCQFLVSKIYDKIWHCFKTFYDFCVSENFGMSPVLGRVNLMHYLIYVL